VAGITEPTLTAVVAPVTRVGTTRLGVGRSSGDSTTVSPLGSVVPGAGLPVALARVGPARLAAVDGDSFDDFGGSVAVSSNCSTALVGARRDDDPNGVDADSAYVFDLGRSHPHQLRASRSP
jgi:hypothetical protein